MSRPDFDRMTPEEVAADVTAILRDARARGRVGATRDRFVGDIW
jgi:hypothetical protein